MRYERSRGAAALFPGLFARTTVIALLLLASADDLHASERLHVTGLVERMCPGESHCFEIEPKPEYREIAGRSLRVRFAGVEQIYDPENYRLTLAQQDIGPGSHLRLLLERDAARDDGDWRAIVIWIGD